MPQNSQEIARLSAVELRRRMHARELSPVEVVEACLTQIDKHNGLLNAVCTRWDHALEEARAAERRLLRENSPPPLLGVPFGVKDVTPTAGLRTTFGSPLYADHVPLEDALVVSRLKAAGAILIGKTNTPEFAAGGHTFNDVFGVTRNPWNPDLSPGGSTGGGAAALASGMIALAEGTDLGGSLRIPASFCGIVGLRPSPGLVPTYPSEYLWDSLQVTGGMARTAADVALMLQAIAGPSPLSPLCQPIAGRDFVAAVQRGLKPGMRFAYTPEVAAIGIDAEIKQICRKAALDLQQAGAEVEERPFDLSFAWQPFLALRGLWMVAHQYGRLDRLEQFGENLAGNTRAGLATTMEQIGAAEKARGEIWAKFHEFFRSFDCLLTPCMAVPPFPAEKNYPEEIGGRKMNTYVDWLAPTFVLSMSGLPVCSVPCGLDSRGLPVGLQVVGPPLGEEQVLAVAQRVQEACPIGLPDMEPHRED